jgi:ABC-2 type transport system permease protein
MSIERALLKKIKYNFFNLGRVLSLQSRLKGLFILLSTIALITGMTIMFYSGFRYFDTMSGFGSIIINKLFTFFFLGMGVMLVFSSFITSYSTIFRSGEIPFLLVRPVGYNQITIYKFFESTLLSSWAFVFIILPYVGAYAAYNEMSVLFAIWTLIFSVPFLIICSAIGSIFIIIFVRFIPKSKKTLIFLIISAGLILITVLLINSDSNVDKAMEVFDISNMLPGLNLASNPVLPSFWTSEGIMALTHGQIFRGLMFWLLLMLTAAVFLVFINDIGRLLFYNTWLSTMEGRSNNKRAPVLFKWLNKVLFFLAHDIKAMIKKDIRVFFRDPVQWSQVLIFFGLIGLYFINIRNFNYHNIDAMWKNMIAFLNVFCLSMVLSSLGSRFIYPQLSLEGQGFWVIGLSPTSMKRIVLTKFFSSLFAMMIISVALILISSSMLNVEKDIQIVTIALIISVSIAVCGLSTGLGAIFIDLKQRNPAAIVSGFGGTLNLILSLCFMILSIVPTGLILHLKIVSKITNETADHLMIITGLWIAIMILGSSVLPLIVGIKSLNKSRDI